MVTPLLAERTTAQFLWLDLTRKCQLSCTHCYNESGPDGSHGTMTREIWISVLDQAVAAGVRAVQFIGGEPTMHQHFAELVNHALNVGLDVEVYTNLVHVPPRRWKLFQRDGLSLATSYYSATAEEHDARTGRRSHSRTRANIRKAVELGVPLRAGIVADSEQQIAEARRDLQSLGVQRISADHVREFGRASSTRKPDTAGLCGGCGDGRAVIDPTGTVAPCVFSTWMGVGNVHNASLASILSGPAFAEAVDSLRADWGKKDKDDDQGQNQPCNPDCVPQNRCDPGCSPNDACTPGSPGSDCKPRN